jgi:hypothetical protein
MKRPEIEFTEGLYLYIQTYSSLRAADVEPLTREEIVGSLVAVMASIIDCASPADYRRSLIAAVHSAIDNRMALSGPPASEAIN